MKAQIITACLATLLLAPISFAQTQETDENAYPLLQQSSLFLRDGKDAEAQAGFEKCLTFKLSPKHESSVRATLGQIYLQQKENDKALEFLKKSRDLDAENYSVLAALGSAFARKGDYAEARKAWEGYLKGKPDGEAAESVKKGLASLDEIEAEDALLSKINNAVELYNKKEYAQAIAILEETQKTQHKHGDKEQEILGMCYAQTGKYKQAIEIYKKSLAINPKQPKTISALAAAYEGMGDLKSARAALKQYLKEDRHGEDALAAKERMPVLKKVMKQDDASGEDYFKAVSTPAIGRWSLSRMPLRVHFVPGTDVPSFQPDFEKGVAAAFDLWCNATDGKISWTQTPDQASADIVVLFTADPKEVGKSESHMEAGICEVDARGIKGAKITGITHATIKMLTNNEGKPYTVQEIANTAAHEVGHSLGMRGHSADPNDTMFFAATKNTHEGLTERDKNTIRAIYSAQVYDDGRIVVGGEKKN
jgi:tetratricopeptide (TPR) repeat protein